MNTDQDANFTNSHGVTHPSEPNYVANIGGSFFGIQDDIAIDAAGTLYVVWQDGIGWAEAP